MVSYVSGEHEEVLPLSSTERLKPESPRSWPGVKAMVHTGREAGGPLRFS